MEIKNIHGELIYSDDMRDFKPNKMKPQIQIKLLKGYTLQDAHDMTLGFVQAVAKHFPKFSTGEIAEMLMNEEIEVV